jgi:hypothetical protein
MFTRKTIKFSKNKTKRSRKLLKPSPSTGGVSFKKSGKMGEKEQEQKAIKSN